MNIVDCKKIVRSMNNQLQKLRIYTPAKSDPTFERVAILATNCRIRLPWIMGLVVLFILGLLMISCGDNDSPVSSPEEKITSSPIPGSESPVEEDRVVYIPNQITDDVKFERLSMEEGLSQSVVDCILQDRYGFMWFATQDGLNRYDGYEFEVYKHDPEDPNSLGDSYVMAMHEDDEGALWLGTHGGGL